MLRAFLEDKTIVFVDHGSGLEDLDGLLGWFSERQKNLPNRYCT
jgi:hypothetical protein